MANPENPKSNVFISYSRKDKAFVKKLNNSLDNGGVAAWVDWEGIPPSADWMAEITRAVHGGDAFVFIISPDSLSSKVCLDELELGITANKKLIVVLHRDPEKRTKMHPKLASTNWIYMRREDNFKANLQKIFDSINTDLGWVQQHTRILGRASEWHQKNRNNSFLLTGTELEEAEKWMTASTSSESRQVTPLQAEYISAGRKNAVQRQRNFTAGVAMALVISLALGVFAFIQRAAAIQNEQRARDSEATAIAQQAIAEDNKRIAEKNERIAEQNAQIAAAQRSASEAKIYQGQAGELDTSTLLAIDAYRHLPDLEDAQNILRHNISLLAPPIKQMSVDARIWTIQLSPDKKKFVSVDSGGKACVWSAEDGSQFFCTQQEGIVYDSTFSIDGQILITGSDAGLLAFWDANTGKQISSLQFEGTIWDLNMNPNGRWLGVGRSDAVSIIDMNNLKENIFFRQTGEVYTIDFDNSGSYMAFGTSTGIVSIWSVMGSRTLAGPKHTNEVYDVEFSPDGKWVISGGADSTARSSMVYSGGQKYFIKHGDWVEDVSFGPESSWFVTVSDDKFVRVIDTATGQERMRMAHDGFVQKVRVSPDGQWIATTGYDRTVRVWDSATGAEILQLPIDGIGSSLQFNGDTTRLIAGDRDGNIYLWDVSSLKARKGLVQFPEFTHEAHFSPDGAWMAVNTDDKNIWLIKSDQLGDREDGRRIIATAKGLTYGLSISPDSRWIAAVEYDSNIADFNRVILIKADGTEKHFLSHDREVVNTVVFTPDNKKVMTADQNGLIDIWNLDDQKKAFDLKIDWQINALAVSPDGKYLAAGTDDGDGTVVWDLSSRTQISKLGQFGSISSIQFSHDGKLLATSGSEGKLDLWNASTGSFSQIDSDFQANGEVTFMDFSRDDTWLAIGDVTGYVYILDTITGQEVARLPHIDKITSISFSKDGSELATVSGKAVMIWDTASIPLISRDQLIATACGRLTRNFTEAKWKTLFFNEDYRPICQDLAAGGN